MGFQMDIGMDIHGGKEEERWGVLVETRQDNENLLDREELVLDTRKEKNVPSCSSLLPPQIKRFQVQRNL